MEIGDSLQPDTSETVEGIEVSRSFKQPLIIFAAFILVLTGIIFVLFKLRSKKI